MSWLPAQKLVTEDFNDNSRGWWVGGDFQTGSSAALENGSYRVYSGHPIFSTWAGFPELEGQTAYTIEFTVLMLSGDPGQSFGMLLGNNRTGNDLQYCFNNYGVFIRQMVASELSFLRDGGEPCPPRAGDPELTPYCHIHPLATIGGICNRLMIVRNGNHYRFFLNDRLMKEATVEQAVEPLIGILVWEGVTIEVKSIKVSLGAEHATYPQRDVPPGERLPFTAENIQALHQQGRTTYGKANLDNDLAYALTVHFYAPDEPTVAAYSVTLQPGTETKLQDAYKLEISVGDDWGISIDHGDQRKTGPYFIQNAYSRIANGTFYIHLSDVMGL